MKPSLPRSQRGAATLIVTLLLAVALFIVVAAAQRSVVVEQRLSAQQRDATQAFHAAEAGVAWALARLNDDAPVGTDCAPAATGPSFAERHLGTAAVAQCVRVDGAWHCGCGTAIPEARGASRFEVRTEATARPDVWRLVASGRAGTQAGQRIETLIARLGAIVTPPAAALTARGAIVAGAASLGAFNADAASGGLTLHAGGSIDAALARVEPPGAMARIDAIAALDPALARRDDTAFFVATFGVEPAAWAGRPGVRRVDCGGGDCAAPLLAAIGPGLRHRMLVVDGDLALRGPLTLGTPEQPIALVVRGTAALRGAIALHGLLHADTVSWHDATAPAATVRGAVVSAGDYRGDAGADIVRDAAVLARLRQDTGSWVRVPGAWRDF